MSLCELGDCGVDLLWVVCGLSVTVLGLVWLIVACL